MDRSSALNVLGQVIQRLRAEKKLSLAALARQSNMTVAELRGVERGLVEPQWPTMNGILQSLNVSSGELAIRIVKQQLAGESATEIHVKRAL